MVTQGHRKMIPFNPAPMNLLTFHTNHRPISHRFRFSEIIGDFRRKSPNFTTLCIFRYRWRGFPWNWVFGVRRN